MSPFAPIDLYCERTAPGLWAEPLNAVSNLAFLLAAWLLWRRQYAQDCRGDMRLLAALIFTIGIGSGLFHLFGTVWGSWLDVGFIALFILAFLHRFLRRIAGWQALPALGGLLLFLACDRAIAALHLQGLNGSESYLLPWIVLLLLMLWARRRAPAAVSWLFGAAAVFAVSLTLRTLDLAVCAAWPYGTHFGWHLLNAWVLYLCVRGLAAGCADRRSASLLR